MEKPNKVQIDYSAINAFKCKNNLSNNDTKLLFEAFRRMFFVGKRLTIDSNFMGLGFSEAYKSKYFTISYKESKRTANWYKLTPEGRVMVKNIIAHFDTPEDKSARQEINIFLFNFFKQ